MPRELEPFCHRLLDLIETIYQPWASNAFQIVQFNQTLGSRPFRKNLSEVSGVARLTLSAFVLAMNDDVDIVAWQKTRSELPLGKGREDRVQLTARCASFLAVSHRSQQGQFVSYFHRTVRGFLEAETCWSKFSMQTVSTLSTRTTQ